MRILKRIDNNCFTLAHGTRPMFEKSRASNLTSQTTRIPAAITLTSGDALNGAVIAAGNGRLTEVLNAPSAFVEFHSHTGEVRHLNKAAIVSIDPLNAGAADQLTKRNVEAAVFDPYAILGMNTQASVAELHQAYLNLARTYHPDRFAAAGLPAEVTEYIGAMAKRINAAWEILSRNQAATPAQ